MKKSLINISSVFLVIFFISCNNDGDKIFKKISADHSGIHFKNILHESLEFNIFNYMYFYNGGGVAVGDLNSDGLLDIYFTSNQESNKLYLNQGDFKFKDVTDISGVAGFKAWTTGVTFADVNADGKLDMYVSYLGDYLIQKSKNQLFINEGNDANGVPIFSDQAMDFGLDLVGFSTQAAFFDYDRDGDLDMYMLNHSVHQNGTFGRSSLRKVKHQLSGDKLFKNENGRFIDATDESGIYSSVIGYGLGIVVSDVNLDGWPDVYVGNDFHENDYLYINQQNGSFKEELESQMNHTSRYTMGVDFADFNNDLFPDLIAMDMLPEDPKILKASQAEDPFDVHDFKIGFGYNHQFSRNALQLNNHNNSFSEIGLLANVSATDWSWATFFADFDLDGNKDLFVSNGINRRTNDLDYINFISVDSIQMKLKNQMSEKELTYIESMPEIKIPNYLYLNNGDSTFRNMSVAAGFTDPSYSNGAAYADFDNDGDLDLVVNNLEDEAFLFENQTIKKGNENENKNSFLQFSFKGRNKNTFGIGTRVILYSKNNVQVQECMPTRGFQSSVDYRLTFGTGQQKVIDSVVVIWPDGKFQKLSNQSTNQHVLLDEANAKGNYDFKHFHESKSLLENSAIEIPYRHKENKFFEFNREALIPHMFSAEGPACAVGDVNNDGREDIFLGGAKRIPASLLIQTKDGKFAPLDQMIIRNDSVYEDVNAVFLDANKDGWQDLFVLSGGNEYSLKSSYSCPRLYMNNKKGGFDSKVAFPDVFLTGGCVDATDFDGDGDVDLFLGGRAIPWNYGVIPDSYLFQNDGKGNFTDVTDKMAPSLRKVGFVTDARWVDMDGDKVQDLVVVGEWFPISIFINHSGNLKPMDNANSGLQDSNGWWNCVKSFDMDSDGDNDLIVGNLGLNSKLVASKAQPIKMYVKDFDGNDSIEQIVTHVVKGKEIPFYTRDEMVKQIPVLKKKFLSYRKYSEATFADIFTKEEAQGASVFECYEYNSSIIENQGNGKFVVKHLPKGVQISTVNAIIVEDFNGDKIEDLMLGGNFYPVNIQMGRYDAGYGQILIGKGNGEFELLPSHESGFSVNGEIKDFIKLTINENIYYGAVRNNDSLKIVNLKRK